MHPVVPEQLPVTNRLQIVFDIVVAHALRMTQPCANEAGSCLYRGPGGNKCFVGAMITDACYTAELENNDSTQPKVIRALSYSLGFDVYDLSGPIRDLQKIHDIYAGKVGEHSVLGLTNTAIRERFKTFGEWVRWALPEFATIHNLQYTENLDLVAH